MKYQPGTTKVTCEYCGNEEIIDVENHTFEELELYPYLTSAGAQKHSEEISMLTCKNKVVLPSMLRKT